MNEEAGGDSFSPYIKLIWGVIYLALYDYHATVEELMNNADDPLTQEEAEEVKKSAEIFFSESPDSVCNHYLYYLGVPEVSPKSLLKILTDLMDEGNLLYYRSGRVMFPKQSIISRRDE